MGRPLKELYTVRWGELSDAAGSAAPIPPLLSKLAWSGEREARDALDEIADRICAMGFVLTEATAKVVPFLADLLGMPGATCRSEVLELIIAIHATRQWEDAAAAATPRYRSSYDEKVSWERSSREAVRAERRTFESLTRDPDTAVAALARQLLDTMDALEGPVPRQREGHHVRQTGPGAGG